MRKFATMKAYTTTQMVKRLSKQQNQMDSDEAGTLPSTQKKQRTEKEEALLEARLQEQIDNILNIDSAR